MKTHKKTLFEFESEVFRYYEQSSAREDKSPVNYGEKTGAVEKLMQQK
jgi:hypothetical protein